MIGRFSLTTVGCYIDGLRLSARKCIGAHVPRAGGRGGAVWLCCQSVSVSANSVIVTSACEWRSLLAETLSMSQTLSRLDISLAFTTQTSFVPHAFWIQLLLPAIRSLERKARYLFYFCCFVRFFVNDFSTTLRPIHAKFCMRAYSGSECVFSPFGGWRPPAGGKRGKWNFRYYGSHWGIFAFWRFLSDISAMLARIQTKYYLFRDNVCRRAPSPCGAHRPLEGGGRGS